MKKNNENENLNCLEKNMDLFVMDEVDSKKNEKLEIYSDEAVDDILKEVLNNNETIKEEIKETSEPVDEHLTSDDNENQVGLKEENIEEILTNNLDKNTASYEDVKNILKNKNINLINLQESNELDKKEEKNSSEESKTKLFETKTIKLKGEPRGNFKYEFNKIIDLYKINDFQVIKLRGEDFTQTLTDEITSFYLKYSKITPEKQQDSQNENSCVEFKKQEDSTKIRQILIKELRLNFLRTCFSGFIFAFLFLISIFFRLNVFANLFGANNIIYILINFVSLIFTACVCYNITLNGFISAFKLNFSVNSGLAFSGFVCLLQNIFALLNPSLFANGGYVLFNLLVIFAYFITSIGQFLNSRRIIGNFNFISAKKSNYKTCCIYNNEKKAQELFKGLGNYQAQIAYQNNADFLCDFIRLSKAKGLFEKSCDKLSLIGSIASIVIFLIYFISTKNPTASISVLALCFSLSFPLSAGFVIDKLMFNLCGKINKNQAMIVGFPAIKKFSETNAILIDANILYPKDSVYLHKIKGAGPLSVDHVVLITAAILQKAKSPLAPIFENVIKGKKDLIPNVDNVLYIDGLGLEAWVQGHKVLIGNREFMEENKVHIDKNEVKEKQKNKEITYIAFANELVCSMVTSYKPNANLIQKMQNLEDQGVSFLVHTTDPNINAKNIANSFKIFFRSIKVISHKDYLEFENDVKNKKIAPAFTTFSGSVYSFFSVVLSCIRLKANITALTISQIFCFIICFCTISVLIFYSGILSLHLLEIFFYCLFWSAAVFAISKVRK